MPLTSRREFFKIVALGITGTVISNKFKIPPKIPKIYRHYMMWNTFTIYPQDAGYYDSSYSTPLLNEFYINELMLHFNNDSTCSDLVKVINALGIRLTIGELNLLSGPIFVLPCVGDSLKLSTPIILKKGQVLGIQIGSSERLKHKNKVTLNVIFKGIQKV